MIFIFLYENIWSMFLKIHKEQTILDLVLLYNYCRFCNLSFFFQKLTWPVICTFSVTSVNHPTLLYHHSDIPISLVHSFYMFNILMKSFTSLFKDFQRKIPNVNLIAKKKWT